MTKVKNKLHSLEECQYLITGDSCADCGDLSACICLNSVIDYSIESIDSDFANYSYEFKPFKSVISYFGYASTYADALSKIAHSGICAMEAKR